MLKLTVIKNIVTKKSAKVCCRQLPGPHRKYFIRCPWWFWWTMLKLTVIKSIVKKKRWSTLRTAARNNHCGKWKTICFVAGIHHCKLTKGSSLICCGNYVAHLKCSTRLSPTANFSGTFGSGEINRYAVLQEYLCTQEKKVEQYS